MSLFVNIVQNNIVIGVYHAKTNTNQIHIFKNICKKLDISFTDHDVKVGFTKKNDKQFPLTVQMVDTDNLKSIFWFK